MYRIRQRFVAALAAAGLLLHLGVPAALASGGEEADIFSESFDTAETISENWRLINTGTDDGRIEIKTGWYDNGGDGAYAIAAVGGTGQFLELRRSFDSSYNMQTIQVDFSPRVLSASDGRISDGGFYFKSESGFYYTIGVAGLSSGESRRAYFAKTQSLLSTPYSSSGRQYAAEGQRTVSAGSWYTATLSYNTGDDGTITLSYKVTARNNENDVYLEGEYVDAAPYGVATAGLYNTHIATYLYDDFSYTGETVIPYVDTGEPQNVAYETVNYTRNGQTLTLAQAVPVRRIICPAMAGVSAVVTFSGGTGDVQHEITFDENGYWLNVVDADRYNRIILPAETPDGDAVILTNQRTAGYTAVVDQPEQLYYTLNGRFMSTSRFIQWQSSDETVAAVESGIVTGKKDGEATVTGTWEEGVVTFRVTVKGEITTAIETGTVEEYLLRKAPIFSALNAAIAAEDIPAVASILNGTAEESVAKIKEFDISGIRALEEQELYALAERMATYGRFEIQSLDDIYAFFDTLFAEAAVGLLNNLSDPSEIEALIRENNLYYKLPIEEELFMDHAEEVYEALKDHTFENLEELQYLAAQAYIINGIRDTESHYYVEDILNGNQAFIGYDMEHFEALTKRELCIYLLSNKEQITSLEALCALIDGYEEKDDPSPVTPGGGGGGNRGTGGSSPSTGSGVVIGMPVNSEDTNKPAGAPVVAEAQLYTDVPTDSWAYESIRFLTAKKAIDGYPDGSFGFSNLITRSEFLKFLICGFDIDTSPEEDADGQEDGEDAEPAEEEDAPVFLDAEPTAWYYPYIKTAKELGILSGDTNGNCMPDRPITRQEAAAMIYRTVNQCGRALPAEAEITEFSDSGQIAPWAFEAVMRLQLAEVISGIDGRFEPALNTTRAQAAVMIEKAVNKSTVSGVQEQAEEAAE